MVIKLILLLFLFCCQMSRSDAAEIRIRAGTLQTSYIGFASAASSASESVTSNQIPVEMINGPIGTLVTVSYSVTGGTATGGGVDYTLANGTLTFQTFSGAPTTQVIDLNVVNDALVESAETIVITLSGPSGGLALGQATHTFTILDNDSGGGAALIASGAAGSTNAHTVNMPSLNSTGSSVGYMCTSSAGNLIVTDNKGGTWTELDVQGASTEARLWKGTGAAWGSGHVVSIVENGTRYPAGVVAFFSGVTQNGTPVKNSSDSATSIQHGSITPSNATNVLIACLAASGSTSTVSVNGGYTMTGQVGYTDGEHLGVAMAHLVQSAATAGNPTLSWTNVVAARAIGAAAVP